MMQGQVASKTTNTKNAMGGTITPKVEAKVEPPPVNAGTPPPPGAPVTSAAQAPAADAAVAAGAEVPSATRGRNLIIGAVLVGAVGASYMVTINKMKNQVERVGVCV